MTEWRTSCQGLRVAEKFLKCSETRRYGVSPIQVLNQFLWLLLSSRDNCCLLTVNRQVTCLVLLMAKSRTVTGIHLCLASSWFIFDILWLHLSYFFYTYCTYSWTISCFTNIFQQRLLNRLVSGLIDSSHLVFCGTKNWRMNFSKS